jgi:hypothetical protein
MKAPPDVRSVFAALHVLEPDLLDRDGVAEAMRQVAQIKAWADSVQVRLTRRAAALAEAGQSEAPQELLARQGRETGRGAHQANERDRVCTNLPNFEDALAAGAVSSGHVDAISAATKGLDEAALNEFNSHAQGLLADAERSTVDTFQRNCKDLASFIKATQPGASETEELEAQRKRSRVSRWVDKQSGMHKTLIELDPVRDALLWAGIKKAKGQITRAPGGDKLSWDQQMAEAVVAAVSNTGGTAPGTRINVLIDLATLTDGRYEGSVCELSDGTPLPVATVRQMACEAEILPTVLNGDGLALDVGRSQRLATPAQRDALRAMYATCVNPDCEIPFDDCHIHHVDEWNELGDTNLDRLVPLCTTGGCHTRFHERRWQLELDPATRWITIARPDGTVHYHGPSLNRTTAQRDQQNRQRLAS